MGALHKSAAQNPSEQKFSPRLPAEQFRVNPDEYPIFRQQGKLVSIHKSVNRPLGDPLSDYVSYTADTIAAITGETTDAMSSTQEAYQKPFNHIIYLDKSARPVCWMVNVFWDAFTDAKRPPHSFLAIDRADWFRRAGLESNNDGRSRDDGERYTFQDFVAHEDAINPAHIAGIRALYIDGGVDTTDPAEIMQLPTSLEGKRILIVDEGSRTGSTLGIASLIIRRAIPEAAAVETYEFYRNSGLVINPQTGETENAEVPVWYRSDIPDGRGIDDPQEGFYEQRYQENPPPGTLPEVWAAMS